MKKKYIAMENKLHALLLPNKTLMDKIELRCLDYDEIEVHCYVSYECDDDDELDDLLQAIIDTCCVEVASCSDNGFTVMIQVYLPGEYQEDDVYARGDRVYISCNMVTSKIDVTIVRQNNKRVEYSY